MSNCELNGSNAVTVTECSMHVAFTIYNSPNIFKRNKNTEKRMAKTKLVKKKEQNFYRWYFSFLYAFVHKLYSMSDSKRSSFQHFTSLII